MHIQLIITKNAEKIPNTPIEILQIGTNNYEEALRFLNTHALELD